MKLKTGDSAIVNQGMKEPEFEEFEIGGWQGRVVEIDYESNKVHVLIIIEWDSLTLKQIPPKYIQQSEMEELDWQRMNLHESDLNKTTPRDRVENVKKVQEKLSDKYYWFSYGKEGVRISKVLGKTNRHDEMKCLEKWDKHLDKHLSYPVQAIVSEEADDWVIKSGTALKIMSITNYVDMYGIIVKVKVGRETYDMALCEIEVLDKKSMDHRLINDYLVWFGDR